MRIWVKVRVRVRIKVRERVRLSGFCSLVLVRDKLNRRVCHGPVFVCVQFVRPVQSVCGSC